MIRALLWTSLLLVLVALALLAGVFFGKRLADTDAVTQEARIAALGRELRQSRAEVKALHGELAALASSASEVDASVTTASATAQLQPQRARPAEPAYRRFGNTSCTLAVGDGKIDEGCAELRRISASVPQASGR
ncbi:hypothetical protein [Jeongeupia chitinilytica]|nr:hypothetical protein [Jeongeupia chitinilytica]